jgi:peptidoglycan/xylan/chitin deacetylase (PgdA/CDA1 family)
MDNADRIDLDQINEKLRSIQTQAWENTATKDKHGRPCFPKDRAEEFHVPIVSQAMANRFRDIEYPDGKSYAVVLTHDIDLLSPSMPRRIMNSGKWLTKGMFSDSLKEIHQKDGRPHPYSDLRSIAEREEERNAHSTFFIMNAPKDHTGAGYSISDIADQIDEVRRKGSEIALHGSYDAGQSLKKIHDEKIGMEKEIGIEVIGYRNHFLRFQVPSSFEYLAEAGFKYDSTIGFSDNYGFRNGMVHPYHPYINDSKRSSILELPLAIMDCSLYSYMGMTPDEGRNICNELIGQAKKLHGTLVILWHNTTFFDPRYKEWGEIYWNILDKVKEDNGWLCSGSELTNWWLENGH